MNDKIAIACDHGGFALKEAIKTQFSNFEWVDCGTDSEVSVDYPDFAKKLAGVIIDESVARGLLICGTGIGISMAANRHSHIRAALCTDVTTARLTRAHNDANVLALGARIVGDLVAFDIVEAFLNTEFEGGRHARRVEKLKGEYKK